MEILTKKTPEIVTLVDGEFVDPEFLKLRSMSMQESHFCPPSVIASKLAHKITRFPDDLRSHTQRIFIFIEQDKRLAVYSSLIDLFLILEEKGAALRTRMLFSAKHILSDQQFEFLQQSLLLGLRGDVTLTTSNQSLLSQGRKNTRPFVQKNTVNKPQAINVIGQARSYLEYGQIDEARVMLQDAILESPEELEYHQDLLEIFRKIADRDLFISFYEQLLKPDSTLPIMWEQMAEEFNYENRI